MIAEIGTPSGSSHAASMTGHCEAGAVKRELGCAAGMLTLRCPRSCLASQSSPQGGSLVIPSHHTSPSGVRATFVKMVFLAHVNMALGLDSIEVPGATPKNPASGLMA